MSGALGQLESDFARVFKTEIREDNNVDYNRILITVLGNLVTIRK